MKLTDTTQHQSSDEQTYHQPRVSFTFSTHSEDGDTLIEKEITYSYMNQTNEWSLFHYVEKHCDSNAPPDERDWTVEKDIHWQEAFALDEDITIPQPVVDQLDEMLSLDVVKLK
jgi:hypothetical protein